MPPYAAVDIGNLVFMFGLGIGIAVTIALAVGARYMTFTLRGRSEQELEDELHEFGGGVKEYQRPVPWLIWLVFVGYFVWAIGYIIFTGFDGVMK